MNETIDCKSDEGIIIGLIDGMMASAMAVNILLIDKFEMEFPPSVMEALIDFSQDIGITSLQAAGALATHQVLTKAGYPTGWTEID